MSRIGGGTGGGLGPAPAAGGSRRRWRGRWRVGGGAWARPVGKGDAAARRRRAGVMGDVDGKVVLEGRWGGEGVPAPRPRRRHGGAASRSSLATTPARPAGPRLRDAGGAVALRPPRAADAKCARRCGCEPLAAPRRARTTQCRPAGPNERSRPAPAASLAGRMEGGGPRGDRIESPGRPGFPYGAVGGLRGWSGGRGDALV